MSYIIAYVTYSEAGTDYPVNCFRTDIKAGDKVVVRHNSDGGKLKIATVNSVSYLNWKCANTIECLLSETETPEGTRQLPPNCPIVVGLARPYDAWVRLHESGWRFCKPTNKQFQAIYTHQNDSQIANIFFRMNAVDIQFEEKSESTKPNYTEGRFNANCRNGVRHFLAHSGINLLEHIVSFADSFVENTNDYSRYMKPIGSRDRSSEELKRRTGRVGRSFEKDLYDALGGTGENVYLGDGMWLSSGGRWSDEGR